MSQIDSFITKFTLQNILLPQIKLQDKQHEQGLIFYCGGLSWNSPPFLHCNLIIIVMLKFLAHYQKQFFHFAKTLPTAPLPTVNKTLQRFIEERVPIQKYEQSFSSYQSFIEQSLVDNPDMGYEKVIFLDQITRIYELYKLPSKKLLKLHNRLAVECFEWAKSKELSELIKVLMMMQRYNKKKALALFKQQKQTILKNMRSFNSATMLLLLKFLKEEKIDDPLIRETALEILYKEVQNLNQVQIHSLLDCLAWSKKYINKDFLIRVANRIYKLYKTNNFDDRHIFNVMAYISEIEVNLRSRSVYLQQLDGIYELILPNLFASAGSLNDIQINRLASALRRSKYYEETLIQGLINICITRQIKQFASQKQMKRAILLRTFVNIVKTVAVFNYHSPEFKSYVLSVLKLIQNSKELMIAPFIFSKLLWSICVLFERSQVSELYPLIESYIIRAEQIPIHEGMNFYYCYLYLRTFFPRIGDQKQKIYKMLEGHQLQTRSSNIQMEVHSTLLQVGVPCISEFNLNNVICDIMVPEWKNLHNVIIQIHGFRHFFRNVKKLTGSNYLKTKIIKSEMYKYYFISADEWLITEDKKAFMSDFMEHINELEGKKQPEGQRVAKTANRIRGRSTAFKITHQ